MAHVYQDTPNYYTTALQGRYWDDVHADATVTADVGYLGSGDDGWTGSSEDAYRLVYVRHGAGQSRFATGCRFLVSDYPSVATVILAVTDAAGDIQASVVLNTDGTLSAYRGDASGAELVTAAGTLTLDTFYDLGFKGEINAATGAVEIWLGESGDVETWTVYARIDAVNTQGGATSDWVGLYVGSTDETVTCHLYARNGAGAATDLMPGWLVTVKFPTATGFLTDMLPNTGTRHEAIDDAVADDDTTYIYATDSGQSFSVEMDDLTSAFGILALDSVATVQNETGETNAYEPIVVLNADNEDDRVAVYGSWRSLSDSSWRGIHEPYGLNPLTGLAWQPSDVTVAGRTEWGGRTSL